MNGSPPGRGLILAAPGPYLVLAARDCRALLGVLLPIAQDLQERGAVARLEALIPVMQRLGAVVEQRPLVGVFGSELRNGASDPLAAGSDQWVGTAETATRLGIAVQTVTRMCRLGVLEAHQIGGRWVIERSAVEQLAAGRKGTAA